MNRNELKPGDEVLVKGIVKSLCATPVDCVEVSLNGFGNPNCHVWAESIVFHTPRPLQVGDEVISTGGFRGTLVGIDEDVGWIKLTNSTHVSLPLSKLAHAPD